MGRLERRRAVDDDRRSHCVGAEAEDRRRDIVQTMRYQRGRRPPAEREETVVDGKRVLLGGQAITRTYAMRWLGSVGGDNLHVDDDGTLWEWRNEDAASGDSQPRELTPDEARSKYGIEP